MRRHLSPEEMLALAEGQAPPDAGHAARCETCRHQVEDLRAVIRQVQSAEVPEPSPLFWDHLSHRIHDAVVEDIPPRTPPRAWAPWLATALPLTAGIALALTALVSVPRTPPTDLFPAVTDAELAGPAPVAEPEWQFLIGLLDSSAEALEENLAAVEPGDVERLVAELDAGERAALVTLLEDEVRQMP